MAEAIGRVAALWRYPVKSMLGEALPALEFDCRGAIADREFAIRNAEGKFGSGKNTRRFRRIDGLFRFRAQLEDGCPAIRFPDGTTTSGADPTIHDKLSEVLGQPVTLAREGAIPHHDQAPVHLVTSAATASLRARLPKSQIDPIRFRPNIVIEPPDAAGLTEQAWIGSVLRVGNRVRLRIVGPAERCVMVTNPQDELPSDPEILREIAQANHACFGVYAEVVEAGEVRIGDKVALHEW